MERWRRLQYGQCGPPAISHTHNNISSSGKESSLVIGAKTSPLVGTIFVTKRGIL